MTPKEKAQNLITQFLGELNTKEIAQKFCDEVLNEITLNYEHNQKRIDFWLDVKIEIKAI